MSTFDAVRRSPSESGALAGDRQALIEQLLLAGLDHYFSGRFEEAIHVWTRVFFLDRGHARARAYIERARGAVAERQREAEAQSAEETLRATQSALAYSTASTASAGMMRGAVELSRSDGPPRRFTRRDLLWRSADPEPVALPDPPPALHAAPVVVGAGASGRLIAHVLLVSLAVVLLFGAGYVVFDRDRLATWWRGTPETLAPPPVVTSEPLPAPRLAEQTIARARTLFAGGHLQEAARLLSSIRPDDALRQEADRLTAEIQRAMLDAAGLPAASDARRAAPLPER